jgi:hypothetical protein
MLHLLLFIFFIFLLLWGMCTFSFFNLRIFFIYLVLLFYIVRIRPFLDLALLRNLFYFIIMIIIIRMFFTFFFLTFFSIIFFIIIFILFVIVFLILLSLVFLKLYSNVTIFISSSWFILIFIFLILLQTPFWVIQYFILLRFYFYSRFT